MCGYVRFLAEKGYEAPWLRYGATRSRGASDRVRPIVEPGQSKSNRVKLPLSGT
jgi:hypothetical protein